MQKNLLTLQEQFETLTAAGYDMELTLQRCVAETGWLESNMATSLTRAVLT